MVESDEIKIGDWIESLQMIGKHAFSKEMLEGELPGYSLIGLKRALNRLSRKGKIVSIYKGYYLIISLQYALRGILPPDIFLDAFMTFLQRPYYLSLLNAAAYHGASHQQPQEFFVVTNSPALLPIHKKSLKINFISKRTIPMHLVEKVKTESGYLNVSKPILTATDLIQFEHRVGGINRVATILNELAEEINPVDFNIDLVKSTPVFVLQRLGYLLEKVIEKPELAESLYKILISINTNFFPVPLKSSRKKNGFSTDERWKVIKNLPVILEE